MLRNAILASALICGVSSVALAADQAPQATSPSNGGVREQMTKTLEQSGFTNINVVPDAYLVSAKDKAGRPVTLFINPNSMTEMIGMNAPAQGDATRAGAFASIPETDDLSSKIVGLDVYNSANQDIGTIKDIAFDANGARAYIVGVGGFLGMGDHYVAVRPSALQVTYNATEKKWHAAMDTTADQLKKAPEYKYPTT
jgi:PRC-barrel domain